MMTKERAHDKCAWILQDWRLVIQGTQDWLEKNMVHVNNDETTPSPRLRLWKMSTTVAEAAA